MQGSGISSFIEGKHGNWLTCGADDWAFPGKHQLRMVELLFSDAEDYISSLAKT